MKLNPPASSSDLEAAREIAQRLHQSGRREDRNAATWSSEEAPAPPRLTPPPLPSLPPRPAALEPREPPRVAPEVRPSPRAEPAARVVPPARPPARPAPSPPPPPAPAPPEMEIEVDASEPSFDLPEAPPSDRPSWSRAADPEPALLEDFAGSAEPDPFGAGEQQLEPEMPHAPAPSLSHEAMVEEENVVEASPFDQFAPPEASPFAEELLDVPHVAEMPSPPSWDEIVQTCMGLARAAGAMLVGPSGQVFAARGDWPAPGPDVIATKLVSMMAKTLKDAPTRSISAPLMGMHLTAWRVPLNEGLVTAAFIGAAPIRAEVRPAVDKEIRAGA